MNNRLVHSITAAALVFGLCAGCEEKHEALPATTTPSVSGAPAATGSSAVVPATAASSVSTPPSASKLPIQWKVRRTKDKAVVYLLVGKEVVTAGPIGTGNDAAQPQAPKVTSPSPQRSEIAGAVEGAPWYSATLKDGALVVERQDPETGKAKTIASIATTATELTVKPFKMPVVKPPACPQGTFLGPDDECLKECASDADCAKDQKCELVRDFSEGRLGPVVGSTCTP